jgi:hypothetical protein
MLLGITGRPLGAPVTASQWSFGAIFFEGEVVDTQLQQELHDHDVRLTRVEVELQGMHKELKAQREDIRINAQISREVQSDIRSLVAKVSELAGSQKLLIAGLGVFGAFLGGLEIWTVFT